MTENKLINQSIGSNIRAEPKLLKLPIPRLALSAAPWINGSRHHPSFRSTLSVFEPVLVLEPRSGQGVGCEYPT
jgi:hypothetical protein